MTSEKSAKNFVEKPSVEHISESFNALELLDFDNGYWESVGTKGKGRVNNCTFRSAVLVHCYFRGVVFTNCDFTSAKFIDCNFKEAKFVHCKFNYSSFRRTIVESSEIIANLPVEPNVRRDLLRNLRVDARELGSTEDESLYIRHEIAASDLFCISAFLGKDPFYRNKYGSLARWGYLGQWLQSKISGAVWGNGEKPIRLIFTCLALTALIAAVLLFYGRVTGILHPGENFHTNLWLAIKLAIMEFVGVPYTVSEYSLRVPIWISVIAVCLRYVVIGLLVSVMFRTFSRR
jgi:hypothetical protein